jgi:nitrogen fixation NifU-like protein
MSPELIDHFQNPRNAGDLPAPAITVEVSNPICGDILRLSVLAEGGFAREVRFKVRGCTASIAAGSALTELISGREAGDWMRVNRADVEKAIGGLSNESKHAAVLCEDAVKALSRAINAGRAA